MSTNSLRQRSLERRGGLELINTMPREDRALVLAAVMQEDRTKRSSEIAYAFRAFLSAVEKGDPVRASKIFNRHKLGESEKAVESRAAVSAKISELDSKGDKKLSDSFAILFFNDADATSRFSAWGAKSLEMARQKMMTDYPLTHVLLKGIIEAERQNGVSIHSQEAYLLLVSNYIRRGDFSGAAESFEKFMAEKEVPNCPERFEGLKKELWDYLKGVSEGYLAHVAQTAERHPSMLSFCEFVISEKAEDYSGDLDSIERNFRIAKAFGMYAERKRIANNLIDMSAGMAEAQPEKFYHEYLRAARISAESGGDKTYEYAEQFVAMCGQLGEKDSSAYAEGLEAAIEFQMQNEAFSIGKKAFRAFVSEGKYDMAADVAERMCTPGSSVSNGSGPMLSAIKNLRLDI